MPHQAAVAIKAWLSEEAGKPNSHAPIDAAAIEPCVVGLQADAVGLYYSAVISLTDALVGLSAGSFAWATVKLYYSSFYAVRSILASNSIALFYHGSVPYSFRMTVGSIPKKESGVTHKVVWSVMEKQLPNHPLLGDIDGDRAYNWITRLRETANYRDSKFCDPHAPEHFDFLSTAGLESALRQYIGDSTMLHTFDAEHASIAFPIECLRKAKQALSRIGRALDQADLQHIRSSAARASISELVVEFAQ